MPDRASALKRPVLASQDAIAGIRSRMKAILAAVYLAARYDRLYGHLFGVIFTHRPLPIGLIVKNPGPSCSIAFARHFSQSDIDPRLPSFSDGFFSLIMYFGFSLHRTMPGTPPNVIKVLPFGFSV
jgi:hypothetical protein